MAVAMAVESLETQPLETAAVAAVGAEEAAVAAVAARFHRPRESSGSG
jgi:hypothetical protein